MKARSKWRFALQPRWLGGHLIIVGVVALFVYLSMWQMDRLHGRQASNTRVRQALSAPALRIGSAALPGDAQAFRNVTASGTWIRDRTVYVRYPIVGGRPGYYVITPLQINNTDAVLVNRGWIPVDDGRNATRPGPEWNAETIVSGWLRDGEKESKATGDTGASPSVPTVTSVDLDRFAALMPELRLAPKWIQLTTPSETGPFETSHPQLLAPPELNEGSHFSYALQWAAFAVVTVVGWAVLLYRSSEDG